MLCGWVGPEKVDTMVELVEEEADPLVGVDGKQRPERLAAQSPLGGTSLMTLSPPELHPPLNRAVG